MGSSNPHVAVVVDYTNELAQVFAVLWFCDAKHGLDLQNFYRTIKILLGLQNAYPMRSI